MKISSFWDLIVFQKAYKLSMQIYLLTKNFPFDEKYSLTDQIRRSSRSICDNIAESWAKRIYVKAFVNKLTDALGEQFETEVWLKMSFDLQYITGTIYDQLITDYAEVRKMLISIIDNPDKFCKT